MVTTSSGAISIGNLRTEFDISGTSGSRALSAFYDASARPYDAVHSNTNIPSSGAVALSNFYATENTYYQHETVPIFYWSQHTDDSGKEAVAIFTIYWNNTAIVSNQADQFRATTSYAAGGQTYLRTRQIAGSANSRQASAGLKFSVER
jgi:hypothetical protein|tara:strand:+ start:71 stop:517 length:447 start_codon:yes stop_codon:yes gene_type:complete